MNGLCLGNLLPTQNAVSFGMYQQTLITQNNMSTVIKYNIPTISIANLTQFIIVNPCWIK